ncbi:hypothetical protein RHSIM_Rhsim02G0073100 [Rhododendron simsii]|uniref:Uncharacterized protein n=1 Tax=Rhododendron simsii TaxID=118357 RepID=A0A834HDW8_RHOSS|nr:hypothetical protein RHSIM_Rhsim02G0073100 [Rhododendron simsii]
MDGNVDFNVDGVDDIAEVKRIFDRQKLHFDREEAVAGNAFQKTTAPDQVKFIFDMVLIQYMYLRAMTTMKFWMLVIHLHNGGGGGGDRGVRGRPAQGGGGFVLAAPDAEAFDGSGHSGAKEL